MTQVPTDAHPTAVTGDLAINAASFRRHLRAANVSPNTVLAYVGAVEQLADYLAEQGMPTDVASIKREHAVSDGRRSPPAVRSPRPRRPERGLATSASSEVGSSTARQDRVAPRP